MGQIDLGINPFDGDFGDPNFEEFEVKVVDLPICHGCSKHLRTGKVVRRIDIGANWDEEKLNEVEIFYWHVRCWNALVPKD